MMTFIAPSVRLLFMPAWLRLNAGWPRTGCPELPLEGSDLQRPSRHVERHTGVEPVSPPWQGGVLAIGQMPQVLLDKHVDEVRVAVLIDMGTKRLLVWHAPVSTHATSQCVVGLV